MSDTLVAERPAVTTSRFRWSRLLLALLLVAGGIWGARLLVFKLHHAETDDAYLTGYVHQVNAHVAGTIIEARVEQNTEVQAGAVLFRLDPRDHEAKVRQAEAQVAQSDAVIAFTQAQIAETHAKEDQARAQLVKAQADFERAQELTRTKVASSQELDAATAALATNKAALVSAQATALGMESGLKVAHAQRENSQSALDNARLQLSYNTITAPVTGRTSRRGAEVGGYVQPGQTLIAIVQPEVWIEANFKETQLGRMRAGQRAEITIDAFPGQRFTGVVESFSPASGSQFALLPADNATGNFTKVVQRVPVRIRLDPESVRQVEGRLRAGLSAVVAVELSES